MYCRDLVGGIHQLEGSLRARPLDHLAEPLMMTLTLMYELRRSQLRYGMASACIGGGQGIAILVRNPRA